MIRQVPNILTYLRIAIIPVIVTLFYLPDFDATWPIFWLYIMAALTDYVDGYLARSLKVESEIGRFLDPIADKLLVTTIILLLIASGHIAGLWVIAAIVILLREIFISGLREFLGPKNVIVHVSKLAKYKTAFQLIALAFLILGRDFALTEGLSCRAVGQWLLLIAAILTVMTGYGYTRAGLKYFQ